MKELNVKTTEFLAELGLIEEVGMIVYYEDCKVFEAVLMDKPMQFLIDGDDVMAYFYGGDWYEPTNCSPEFMFELIEFLNDNNLSCYNDSVPASRFEMLERACDGGQFYDDINIIVKDSNSDNDLIAIVPAGTYTDNESNIYAYAIRSACREYYTFFDSYDDAIKEFQMYNEEA